MFCFVFVFGLMYVVQEEVVSFGGIFYIFVCCQLIIGDEYLYVNRDIIIVIFDSNMYKIFVGWIVKFCGYYLFFVG